MGGAGFIHSVILFDELPEARVGAETPLSGLMINELLKQKLT